MEKSIKYRRFTEKLDENSIQEFLDKLVTEGWEIISYKEEKLTDEKINITVVGSKRQNNVL